MSKILPRQTVDVLRQLVDISLDNYGVEVTLYIPTNISYGIAEKLDVFKEPDDYEYTSYTAMVFINWNPSTYRLKKYGIFVEGEVPILAWMPNKATALEGSEAGTLVDVDICNKSYFEINPEFIPSNYEDVEQFEVVSPIIKGMHDKVIYKGFKIAPRRV